MLGARRRARRSTAPTSTTAATSPCTSRAAPRSPASSPTARGPRLPVDGRVASPPIPVRGIATSGWRGRSFSLGIADAVTVLARTAARRRRSDADRQRRRPPRTRHHRRPARALQPDTDLGDRLVTTAVGRARRPESRRAGAGAAEARRGVRRRRGSSPRPLFSRGDVDARLFGGPEGPAAPLADGSGRAIFA